MSFHMQPCTAIDMISFRISTVVVPWALNLPVTSQLQSDSTCQTVVTIAVTIQTLSVASAKLNVLRIECRCIDM